MRVDAASDIEKIRKVGYPRLVRISGLTVPIQRFCEEVVAWKALRHPNVLPLLGATMTEGRFVMVSEWMVKGDIKEFVKANANADPLELVCFSLRVLTLTSH